jgi:prepilin-type N-terminal cleavage/methylation domain-containing protein
MKNRKKSFTLVEMVVVMIVIGILAVAIIPRLQGVQTKARDTQRKTDLATIRTALEVYAIDS